MSKIIALVFSWFGRELYYECSWGDYDHRYDAIDRMMQRPIHENMSVAPPWARMRMRKACK